MHIHTWVIHTLTHTHIWLWSRLFSVACSWGSGPRTLKYRGGARYFLEASPHWHTSLHSDLSWTSERQPCLASLFPSQTLNFFTSSLHFLYFLKYFIKAFQKKSAWQPRKEPLLKDYLTFPLSAFQNISPTLLSCLHSAIHSRAHAIQFLASAVYGNGWLWLLPNSLSAKSSGHSFDFLLMAASCCFCEGDHFLHQGPWGHHIFLVCLLLLFLLSFLPLPFKSLNIASTQVSVLWPSLHSDGFHYKLDADHSTSVSAIQLPSLKFRLEHSAASWTAPPGSSNSTCYSWIPHLPSSITCLLFMCLFSSDGGSSADSRQSLDWYLDFSHPVFL